MPKKFLSTFGLSALILGGVISGCVGISAQKADETAVGRPLIPTYSGSWSVFYLPSGWVEKHLSVDGVLRAYVRLAEPHVDDLEGEYAPCDPPQRIVLGVVESSGDPREHLAVCLNYCNPADSVEKTHLDLWGSLTHLSGVSIEVTDDGSIEVHEHYQKKAFIAPEELETPGVLHTTPVEPEVRVRMNRIGAAQFSFTGAEAGACVVTGENLPR